jgi:hypothetical protein
MTGELRPWCKRRAKHQAGQRGNGTSTGDAILAQAASPLLDAPKARPAQRQTDSILAQNGFARAFVPVAVNLRR